MRKTAGWLLLGVSVVGLSYWAHENHAEEIEQFVTAEAATLTEGTRHQITSTVSGRDVTVAGIAHNEVERERILQAAAELPGMRVVHDNLTLLPKADLYTFGASKTGTGISEVTGFVPDQQSLDVVKQATPSTDLASLELSSGEPDAEWSKAVSAGLHGLKILETGKLSINGKSIEISGMVDADQDFAAFEAAFVDLPEGYELSSKVDVRRPYAEIYRMVAVKGPGSWSFEGVMPDEAAANALISGRDGVTKSDISFAANAPEGWDAQVSGAMTALDLLESGRVEIIGDQIRLTGEAQTQDDLARFETALAALGTSKLVAKDISVKEAAALETVAVAKFELLLDPITGLTVSGATPANLDAAAIAELLGVMKYEGAVATKAGADVTDQQRNKLAKIGAVVSEFEELRVSFDGNDMSVSGQTLFDADPARLSEILSLDMADQDQIRISKSQKVYAEGFRRDNALTGAGELFKGGFWIPEFDASALTSAECAARTEAAVSETKIRYREGSADIDTLSRSILNKLTGIIDACLKREPDTKIMIGGHTDSVGTDADNLELSNRRAGNVLTALIKRGLPQDQLTAKGFGELQPIADNATDEGRAINRRTTFEWAN